MDRFWPRLCKNVELIISSPIYAIGIYDRGVLNEAIH